MCDRKIGPFSCCSIVQGDCLELMKSLPDGCVDAVITDPPYGIGADVAAFNNAGQKGGRHGGHYRTYSKTNWDTSIPPVEWFEWIKSLGVPLVIFGGNYMTESLPPSRCWFIWDKVSRGSWPDFEMAWTNLDKPNRVFQFSRADAYINTVDVKCHPTQKPIELMQFCIAQATKEDETILDPFAGSGTTLVAAKKLGRHFLGFEISPEYCEIARDRLARIDAQPTLFEPKPEQLELGQ